MSNLVAIDPASYMLSTIATQIPIMAQLLVRNLDDDVKARLRILAAEHGRSMEEEVRRSCARRSPDQGAAGGLGTEVAALLKGSDCGRARKSRKCVGLPFSSETSTNDHPGYQRRFRVDARAPGPERYPWLDSWPPPDRLARSAGSCQRRKIEDRIAAFDGAAAKVAAIIAAERRSARRSGELRDTMIAGIIRQRAPYWPLATPAISTTCRSRSSTPGPPSPQTGTRSRVHP